MIITILASPNKQYSTISKTGFKTEKIGKVFSHTQMKPILDFKAMFLCFTDGVSQFLLDFFSMERWENEAISHSVYSRNRQRIILQGTLRW